MAPRDGSQERTGTPADTVEKGMATINTLRYTEKPSFESVDKLSMLHIVIVTSVADIIMIVF